jgi:hypothetical protein
LIAKQRNGSWKFQPRSILSPLTTHVAPLTAQSTPQEQKKMEQGSLLRWGIENSAPGELLKVGNQVSD